MADTLRTEGQVKECSVEQPSGGKSRAKPAKATRATRPVKATEVVKPVPPSPQSDSGTLDMRYFYFGEVEHAECGDDSPTGFIYPDDDGQWYYVTRTGDPAGTGGAAVYSRFPESDPDAAGGILSSSARGEPLHFMSRVQVARYLGIKSVNSLSANRLPPADIVVGKAKGWHSTTIDKWNAQRPGRGRGKRTTATTAPRLKG